MPVKQKSMIQFTPGKYYRFIYMIGRSKHSGNLVHMLSSVWELDEIVCLQIVELECVKEHQVPLIGGSEQRISGFTFKTNDGGIWHNQYPRGYVSSRSICNYSIRNDPKTEHEFSDSIHHVYMVEISVFLKNILERLKQKKLPSIYEEIFEWANRIQESNIDIKGTASMKFPFSQTSNQREKMLV